MRADVGDSLVVKGATNGDPDQRGIITECAHGRRHARLHGSLARTGHQALAFPGPTRSSSRPHSSRRPTSGHGHGWCHRRRFSPATRANESAVDC